MIDGIKIEIDGHELHRHLVERAEFYRSRAERIAASSDDAPRLVNRDAQLVSALAAWQKFEMVVPRLHQHEVFMVGWQDILDWELLDTLSNRVERFRLTNPEQPDEPDRPRADAQPQPEGAPDGKATRTRKPPRTLTGA